MLQNNVSFCCCLFLYDNVIVIKLLQIAAMLIICSQFMLIYLSISSHLIIIHIN
jgi:hypothetical protein